jgi:hypothetical protein
MNGHSGESQSVASMVLLISRTDLTVVSLKEIASGLPSADDDSGAAAAAQAEQAQAARAARLAQGTQQVGLRGGVLWNFS